PSLARCARSDYAPPNPGHGTRHARILSRCDQALLARRRHALGRLPEDRRAEAQDGDAQWHRVSERQSRAMKVPFLSRTSAWLPTVFVLLVVLLAGARLIMLSLDRHADDARHAARVELMERQVSIDSRLAALGERATHEAARVSRAVTEGA